MGQSSYHIYIHSWSSVLIFFLLIMEVRVKIKCTQCQVLPKEYAWNLQTLRKKIGGARGYVWYYNCICGFAAIDGINCDIV